MEIETNTVAKVIVLGSRTSCKVTEESVKPRDTKKTRAKDARSSSYTPDVQTAKVFQYDRYLTDIKNKSASISSALYETVSNIDVKTIKDTAAQSYRTVRSNVSDASSLLTGGTKKTTHFIGSNLKRIISTITVTLTAIALTGIVVSANFTVGYVVIVNGNAVGVVPDIVEYQSIVNEIKNEVKINFNKDITVDVNPTFAMTIIPKSDAADTESVKEGIRASSKELTECFAIVIDNAPPVYLPDEATAYQALNDYKLQFIPSGLPDDATFDRNVSIERAFIPSGDISDYDHAIAFLNGQVNEYADHLVAPGDTTQSIAAFYDIPESELMKANPSLAESTVPQLETVKIPVSRPVLSVILSEYKEYTEYTDFSVETISDASLYEDETEIVTQGQRGEKLIKVKVNTIGGKEISREIISSQAIKPPVTQTEKVGTKKLPSKIGTGSYLRPYSGVVTASFHSYPGHTGIDFAGPTGATIKASDNGEVVFTGWRGNYGNLVIIDHNNGYQTYYAHCSSITTSVGKVVAKGDKIAEIGSTGNSTGPHVHFEIRKAQTPVDPSDFV